MFSNAGLRYGQHIRVYRYDRYNRQTAPYADGMGQRGLLKKLGVDAKAIWLYQNDSYTPVVVWLLCGGLRRGGLME